MSLIPLEYIQAAYLFHVCGPSESVDIFGSFIFPLIHPQVIKKKSDYPRLLWLLYITSKYIQCLYIMFVAYVTTYMSTIPLEYIQAAYLFHVCGPSESVDTYGSFIFPLIHPRVIKKKVIEGK